MPAVADPAWAVNVRFTFEDSAIHNWPLCTPSRMAVRSRLSARTTTCGRPTTSGSLCASLAPTAGSQVVDLFLVTATSWLSHSAKADSSHVLHGLFQTSTASTCPYPNFQKQAM